MFLIGIAATRDEPAVSLASGAALFGARQGLAPDGIFREQRHVSLQRFMRLREPVETHIAQHQRLQQVGRERPGGDALLEHLGGFFHASQSGQRLAEVEVSGFVVRAFFIPLR